MATNVYGPIELVRGEWLRVSHLRNFFQGPWCIEGVFNVVCFMWERRGQVAMDNHMVAFSSFIDNNALVDVPLDVVDSHGPVALPLHYLRVDLINFVSSGKVCFLELLCSLSLYLYLIIVQFSLIVYLWMEDLSLSVSYNMV